MDGTHTVVRGAVKPNEVQPLRDSIKRSAKLDMPKGCTAVLKTTFVAHEKVAAVDDDAMRD